MYRTRMRNALTAHAKREGANACKPLSVCKRQWSRSAITCARRHLWLCALHLISFSIVKCATCFVFTCYCRDSNDSKKYFLSNFYEIQAKVESRSRNTLSATPRTTSLISNFRRMTKSCVHCQQSVVCNVMERKTCCYSRY